MIREAKPDDIERIATLLELLRIESPYRSVKVEWPHLLNELIVLMRRKDALVLVADHEGELTGVMIAKAETLWWVHQQLGARIASDLVFYSQRYGDGRQMLRKMIEWAFSVPRVIRIEMGVSSGQAPIEVMRRLYESEGLSLEGSFFVRNHPQYQAMLAPASTVKAA